MSRSRIPLSNGTVLYCGDNTSFTIYENHQYGGNSLVYSARQSGSERLFKIKECFPVHEKYNFIRNQEGHIVPLTPDSRAAWEYIEECKENLQEEGVLGQKIAAHSGKIIAPMQEVRITSVGDSAKSSDSLWKQFLVMEDFRQKGVSLYELLAECEKEKAVNHPLRSNGGPDVCTVLSISKGLLQVLDQVHKEGYIYGDIQPNNLFFVDPQFELGETGTCYLLDFGCSLRLACGDRTEELTRGVQTTDGFCAPEIRYENDGHLQLTQAADIFSVGCLMYYLLRWEKYGKEFRSSKKLNEQWSERGLGQYIDARSLEGRGGSREITDQINRILRRALQRVPGERYRNAGEMLQVIQALYEQCLEELYAPAGREKMIDDINTHTDQAYDRIEQHLSRMESLSKDYMQHIEKETQISSRQTEYKQDVNRTEKRKYNQAYYSQTENAKDSKIASEMKLKEVERAKRRNVIRRRSITILCLLALLVFGGIIGYKKYESERKHKMYSKLLTSDLITDFISSSLYAAEDQSTFLVTTDYSPHKFFNDTKEWSDFPYSIYSYSGDDCLGISFYDRAGTSFDFTAEYEIEDGEIIFKPSDKIQGHSLKLEEELSYKMEMDSNHNIYLTHNGKVKKYTTAQGLIHGFPSDFRWIIHAKAKDEENIYNDIKYIHIGFSGTELQSEFANEIVLTDNSQGKNIHAASNKEKTHLHIEWQEEYQTYNGGRTLFPAVKSYDFDCTVLKSGLIIYEKNQMYRYEFCGMQPVIVDDKDLYQFATISESDSDLSESFTLPITVQYLFDMGWRVQEDEREVKSFSETIEANKWKQINVFNPNTGSRMCIKVYNTYSSEQQIIDCQIWGIQFFEQEYLESTLCLAGLPNQLHTKDSVMEILGSDFTMADIENIPFMVYRMASNSTLAFTLGKENVYHIELRLYPWDYVDYIRYDLYDSRVSKPVMLP